jgi:phosphocarrier protein HPr
MVEAKVVIKNETGLHARPAAILVNAASGYCCDLKIRKGAKEANLQSMLSLLSLGVCRGEEVTIIATGQDEQKILDKLVELINNLE